jgi:chromosomal replication initiator protein
MEAIWNEVKAAIKQQIPDHCYRMWLEPVDFADDKGGCLVLACPNLFYKKRILDQYRDLIVSELQRVGGQAYTFKLEVNGNIPPESITPQGHHQQLVLPHLVTRPYNGRLLCKDFTFDKFVVGGNSDFAYSAALSLAARRTTQQNALFLLSETGMGKSHLAQAIGHHILAEFPMERVYYITAEDFTNEMIDAFRHNSIGAFKAKYRTQCDVLLLEDVHYLSGKDRTQVELALTLEALIDSGKKIIFSSCYLPADIPRLNDKLGSLLTCGLISSIDPPDYKTRVRILEKKAGLNGCKVPTEIMEYLAGELVENVRQLESGLFGVTAKSSLLGAPIDLNLAESVVKNITRQRKRITIEVIKKLVSTHFKLTIAELVSRSRKQRIVRPRQIAIYLSRKYTDQPLQIIGRSFNRYHATAMHAIGTIEKGMKSNAPIRRQVEFLSQRLESGKF